jgi:hypothetical protein
VVPRMTVTRTLVTARPSVPSALLSVCSSAIRAFSFPAEADKMLVRGADLFPGTYFPVNRLTSARAALAQRA